MFSGYTLPPDSKETEPESSNQEASPSPGKNTRIVLVPYHCAIWYGYFWGPWKSLVYNRSNKSFVSQCGSQKLLQGLLSHELAAYPLDDPIDSGNFCVTVCLPLTQKDSITHIHGLAVYVKEGLPVARSLSPENSVDSHFCFRLALLHAVSYLFFLYRSPSLSWRMVFDSISSNIYKVLSIHPSANVFVFGDFNVHHKDWLTFLVELIDKVNSVIIFLAQMTLLRWLIFLLGSWLWLSRSCSSGFICFFSC